MAADRAKIDSPEGSKTIATILPNKPSCAEGSKGHSRPHWAEIFSQGIINAMGSINHQKTQAKAQVKPWPLIIADE